MSSDYVIWLCLKLPIDVSDGWIDIVWCYYWLYICIFSCFFSVKMYYWTAFSGVFDWICALQVIFIMFNFITVDSPSSVLEKLPRGMGWEKALCFSNTNYWSGSVVKRRVPLVRQQFQWSWTISPAGISSPVKVSLSPAFSIDSQNFMWLTWWVTVIKKNDIGYEVQLY